MIPDRDSAASVNQELFLKVSALMARDNLGFVCAMCQKMWDAEKAGQSGCGAKGCAGPLGGGTFDQYLGLLGEFWHFCFRCGSPSAFGIHVRGKSRVIGVCKSHVGMLSEFAPEFDLSVRPLDRLELMK